MCVAHLMYRTNDMRIVIEVLILFFKVVEIIDIV